MANETSVNPNINGKATEINTNMSPATSINPDFAGTNAGNLSGVILGGRFTIKERLDVSSGEADMYICEDDGKEYVAKIYRREAAIKPEIVEALKNIKSDYIAHTIEIGTYNGFPFEILEYYKNGSLQGKKFSFEELKNNIIPSANEALHVLHSNDPKIIHKDLKPSNIMQLDNGKIALIDFGISSVARGGNTVVNTKTGLTLDYSAPEAIRSVFLEESDYYSLGITLYELFTGHTPYFGMTGEQLAQYTILQQFPFPDNMPEKLKDLIKGLTYNDITHRHELNNPNRRWTYEEVKNWCNGMEQQIPGNAVSRPTVAPYKFEGVQYTNLADLAAAFAENWESGKKQLFRGLLAGYLMTIDQDLASYCMDITESPEDNDIAFTKVLYKMDSSFRKFCWKGEVYDNIQSFGAEMMKALRKNDLSNRSLWDELIKNKVFSLYADNIYKSNNYMRTALAALESKGITLKDKGGAEEMLNFYTLAYLLSGDKTYEKNGKTFESIEELAKYMEPLLDKSFEKFSDFCRNIINEDNALEPQFEAWLISMGKNDEIASWKKEIEEEK